MQQKQRTRSLTEIQPVKDLLIKLNTHNAWVHRESSHSAFTNSFIFFVLFLTNLDVHGYENKHTDAENEKQSGKSSRKTSLEIIEKRRKDMFTLLHRHEECTSSLIKSFYTFHDRHFKLSLFSLKKTLQSIWKEFHHHQYDENLSTEDWMCPSHFQVAFNPPSIR